MNEDTLLDNVMQEAHEKEWREKEHAEAEKIRRMNEELKVAREQQKIMKAQQMATQVPFYIHLLGFIQEMNQVLFSNVNGTTKYPLNSVVSHLWQPKYTWYYGVL